MGSSILGSTLGLVYQDHGWAGLITTLLIGTAIMLAIIVYVATPRQ